MITQKTKYISAGFAATLALSVMIAPTAAQAFLWFASKSKSDEVASLPQADVTPQQSQPSTPETSRELIDYQTSAFPGTVIIDSKNHSLYLVLENGMALRYSIGVGREGFQWSGIHTVTRKQEWPDWRPPSDMLERQPYLPTFFPGGPKNPLGARALYLGSTIYRIHGTNEAWTIGKDVSSGCIRMLNDDIIDLYGRVPVGAKVVVL